MKSKTPKTTESANEIPSRGGEAGEEYVVKRRVHTNRDNPYEASIVSSVIDGEATDRYAVIFGDDTHAVEPHEFQTLSVTPCSIDAVMRLLLDIRKQFQN